MKPAAALLALTLASLCQAATDSPFYLPIRNNDLPALKQLIRDPGPKARDARGNSPLMYAASLGSAESMRLLLDAGADPNAANDLGATPLMWCAGDAVKVRMLLDKGANVNVQSKSGRSPLFIAAAYDGATEAARLLIEKGADVNAADKGHTSVLEMAAGANNLEVARLLISKGANVNNVDEGGGTSLISAAGNGDRNAAMVKLLIEHGANVNVKTGDTAEIVKNGSVALGHITALHFAANQANYEAVEALINAGADINAKDVRNSTPLVWAVTTDRPNPKIVKLLLAKGADPKPALDWVRRYQNPAILPLFGLKPPSPVTGPMPALDSPHSPKQAIAMAIPVTQSTSSKFLETGGCVSCHAQHLTGMAVAAAKATGVNVNTELETGDVRATTSLRGAVYESLFQVEDPPPGVDGVEFSLLQLAAAKVPNSLAIDAMVHHIAAMQRKEGDWPNYGPTRPPFEDGGFNQTARGIRVLQLYNIPGRKAEFDARIARAASWLENHEPVTTEDRATQILGLLWAGRPVPANRVQQLIAQQRPDGGWGQTPNLPEDAWATGEVLWALHDSGMKSSNPVYSRGIDYLISTQQKDGTWHVVSRALGFQPYFQSGFPYEHDQWISQAGTAMAIIALSLGL